MKNNEGSKVQLHLYGKLSGTMQVKREKYLGISDGREIGLVHLSLIEFLKTHDWPIKNGDDICAVFEKMSPFPSKEIT